ncbi:MAG: ABC transporter ATP-binding protein [Alphaproteobacteria bacterium]
MIDVDALHLTLTGAAGPVNVLNGVSFTVKDGDSVALLGPSGSGKTSLLMLIAGLERASAGHVRVAGQDLSTMSEDALARFRARHVGIVFQSFHLVPTMTAVENVAIPLELAGRADAFERARAGLDQVGLGGRLNHYPGELSGGEQQRVALARAIAPGPRLLLADEPTGNLDGATGETVIRLLFDLARDTGATLLLVTHDEALAGRCGRLLRLADGRIAGDSRQAA